MSTYAVFLFIGALVALLAFVMWDRRRLQSRPAPLPREQLASGWRAKPHLVWPLHLGFALVTALFTARELYTPSRPPFSGRMSSVYTAAFSVLGEYGVAYFWLAVTLLLLLLALVAWLARTALKTNGLPQDPL